MTIKEFAAKVQAEVAAKLKKKVELKEVIKLNGIRRYGLLILNPDTNASPTIYLESFFHRFLEAGNWDCTINDIISAYQDNVPDERFDTDQFLDFSQIKEKVFYRLINYEANRELLDQMPHSRFLDLAKVFCVLHQSESMGNGIIPIYNTHLERWGINSSELQAVAEANTPLLMKVRFSSMDSVLAEMNVAEEILSEPTPEGFPLLYVMSNIYKANGAATICYQNALKDFSMKKGSDIIILPSSLHEVILIPLREDDNLEELRCIVHCVNRETVLPEEFLSDNVYIYRRNTGQIEIA